MTRIAILKSGLGHTGGLEKVASRLASAFAERKCEVTILTTCKRCGTPPPEAKNFTVHSLGKRHCLGVKNRKDFDRWAHKWLSQNRCDIVFGMDRNRFQTHYRAGDGIHREQLEGRLRSDCALKRWSLRFNPLQRLILNLEKQTLEHPELKKLFTNSYMVKEQALNHYNIDPQKISVIHNGVEWNEMQGAFDRWQEICDPQIDPSRYHFLFIGHGFRRKGLAHLLHALAHLPKDSYQLSVVGREKRLKPYLKLIRELRLEQNVILWGPQADVWRFLQLADAVVIPSLYDPFANVTVEGLAMGLQVVTSKHNGGKEVLTPETGLVFPTLSDPEGMAETLREALQRPKTAASAVKIRQSVRHLDFSKQLTQIIDETLNAC